MDTIRIKKHLIEHDNYIYLELTLIFGVGNEIAFYILSTRLTLNSLILNIM